MTASFHKISLPSSLTIENVRRVSEGIKAQGLKPGDTLEIDAALTEAITTPGMQLLLSLERTVAPAGGKLAILRAKTAFTNAFRLAGLEQQLTKWGKSDG